MQDANGQVVETHSISAGLDYPGVGPEHSYLKDSGRATYVAADDETALAGFQLLSRIEGIIPALESAHAIGALVRMRDQGEIQPDEVIILNLSGRGDKDIPTVASLLEVTI